jgi:hypothetical protein
MQLQSIAEAKCMAVRYAGEVICDTSKTFWNTADFHMWVTDATGLTLFALRLSGTDAPAIGAYAHKAAS